MSERANGQASDPVLQSVFLDILDHSAIYHPSSSSKHLSHLTTYPSIPPHRALNPHFLLVLLPWLRDYHPSWQSSHPKTYPSTPPLYPPPTPSTPSHPSLIPSTPPKPSPFDLPPWRRDHVLGVTQQRRKNLARTRRSGEFEPPFALTLWSRTEKNTAKIST